MDKNIYHLRIRKNDDKQTWLSWDCNSIDEVQKILEKFPPHNGEYRIYKLVESDGEECTV